jgi:hypothetical protein
MAAGLGFIEFTTGDVLTAAAANGYLASQVVMVFADSAARTTAITSPQEGMISFLKDTNSTEYYSGSAWIAIGGGSSPLTTKGDLYTFDTADARLGVGADGTVLTADSVEATGLKWVAPSSGALVLLNTTSFTGVASQSINDVFSATYDNYKIVAKVNNASTAGIIFRYRVAGSDNTTSNYNIQQTQSGATTVSTQSRVNRDNFDFFGGSITSQDNYYFIETIFPFASETTVINSIALHNPSLPESFINVGGFDQTTSFTGFSLIASTGNISGKVSVYGYTK